MTTTTKAKVGAIVSFALAILTAVSALALPDNYKGWVAGALTVLTAVGTYLGVYQATNKPIPPGD